MNFDLSDEQALLKATAERFARERHGRDTERRRSERRLAGGFDRAGWKALADLGILALPLDVSLGGLGGGPVDVISVAEPLGAWLATEPFTECLIPSVALLEAAADRAHLPAILSGDCVPAVALGERAGRYNLYHVETRAEAEGGQWRLSGTKSAVWQGGAADLFLVSARMSGEVRDPSGIGLFTVQASDVERRPWVAADGSLAAELSLRDTPGQFLECDAADALEAMLDRCWLAATAEMLGVAGMLLEATLAYVKTRVQFGRPIGQFQVIQHRLVDCHVALEQARSMLLRAAALDGETRAVAGARAYGAEAALKIAHEAVQFHGGMGVTDELIVGHGLKRLQMLARIFGDSAVAAQRFAEAA
jgi:alkylation response protein AidB-like acyl-CoA dehydrogenase